MDKLAFIDIGDLGWSLYLSAHIRWLKKNTDSMVAVISLLDRKCLYEGLADEVIDVPEEFYKKYDLNMQDSFKLRKVSWFEIVDYLRPFVPEGYVIPEFEKYPHRIFSDNRIYTPYKYSKLPEDGKEIIIFPRCRSGLWVRRNLPEIFYLDLINRLCDEFPKLTIRTIGTNSGAYDMKIDKPNYINWVGKANDLQDMINRCQPAIAAVGSQSAPPKISLLQGVPTFIIGHQKGRHTEEENWMGTKVDFYQIDKRAYGTFNDSACINAIIRFVRKV